MDFLSFVASMVQVTIWPALIVGAIFWLRWAIYKNDTPKTTNPNIQIEQIRRERQIKTDAYNLGKQRGYDEGITFGRNRDEAMILERCNTAYGKGYSNGYHAGYTATDKPKPIDIPVRDGV